MHILDLDEAAKRCGIVRRSLERIISIGEGPPVIRISARRRGIIDEDLDEWARGRRIPRPGRTPDDASEAAKRALSKTGASTEVKPGDKFRRKIPERLLARRTPAPGEHSSGTSEATSAPAAPKAGAPPDVKPGGKLRRKVPAHVEAV
jgi:hypothetical protein